MAPSTASTSEEDEGCEMVTAAAADSTTSPPPNVNGRIASPQVGSAPNGTAAGKGESAGNSSAVRVTIIDEAQECLAQSLMMFLFADLRMLSATGRINTKFETLCVDSDVAPRCTSSEIAQCSPPDLPRHCEGISPSQIMAILIVELRQEVLAQRKRAKVLLRKRQEERGWVPILSAEEDDDNKSDDEDDDDAGVLNKLTDRKRRKDFESEIHQQIRLYNDMLASDLKGLPEVKLARMFPPINPLRRNNNDAATPKKSPWFRPSHFTQQLSMIFSQDDIDEENDSLRDHSEDDQRSKNSLTVKKNSITTLFASPYAKRKQLSATPKDVPKSIDGPERPTSGLTESDPERRQLSASLNQVDEAQALENSESGESGEELQLRATTSSSSDMKRRQSRLHALVDSLKGQPRASTTTQEEDLESLFSDPGPNRRNLSSGQRAPTVRPRIREIKQGVTEYVERYREDHAIHHKFIIPADDYETFAGAEDVGNKMLQLTSNIMSHGPPDASGGSSVDSGRNMSEKELLDYINRCISSNQGHSLDFMAGFFRDNTVSKTMVNSKARIVWIHDWYPLVGFVTYL